MLLALAAANGAPLSPQTISSLTGIPSVVPILESLCLRKLVKDYGNRLQLSDALTKHLSQTMDLTGIYRQILDFFVAWVERYRDNPARVQREWDAIFATPELSRTGGSPSTIIRLGKALDHSLALSGQWTLWEETLQKVLVAAQIEEDPYNEAWALHQMGARAMCLGEEESAEYFLNRAFEIRSAIGDPFGAAVTQHNLELLLQQQEAAKGSMALVRIGTTALTFSGNDDEEQEEDSALMVHSIALEHRPRSLVRSAGASFIRLAALLALMIGSHSSLEVASKEESMAAFAPSQISITGQPINSVSLPYMAFFINQQQTPLSIGEIIIDGDSLNEFVITENDCTDKSLIPNGNCKVSVAYSPSTGGRHNAALIVKTKDGRKAAELRLTGVVAGREGLASANVANEDEELLASMTPMATSTTSGDQPLSVNTTVIAFEHLGDGKKSIAQVSLQNETDRSVPVSELKLIGAGASDFRVKNNCQPQLTAKRKCRIDFEFKPQLSGERMAALKISSSAGALPLYVLLKGVSLADTTNVEVASAKIGPSSALSIEARPNRVDFGLAVSRTAASQEIMTIKNLSASPLTISSISLKDGAAFLLNDVNCRGRSVNPQDTCSLSLGFKPPGDGEYKATLIIQTAAGISPLMIPIEGRAQLIGAQAPNLAIFPNPLKLNFTGRPVSDSKLTRGIVRLSNQGENTLTVNEVDVDGPDADVFNLAHQCKGAQLAPDGHCDIEVVFKPPQASSPAERKARLIVKFNGGAASQSIVLNGSIGGQR
jgi:hypothetical protein